MDDRGCVLRDFLVLGDEQGLPSEAQRTSLCNPSRKYNSKLPSENFVDDDKMCSRSQQPAHSRSVSLPIALKTRI